MDIVRLFGRPWSELTAEHTPADLLGWYRVYTHPAGKPPAPSKRPPRGRQR